MKFGLSTRWNCRRHTDGEALADEIAAWGFPQIELSYDLRADLLPGIRRAVAAGRIAAVSVHNFCPVPSFAPRGSPEFFLPAGEDETARRRAVADTLKTVATAAEVGAGFVVVHSGYARMRNRSRPLLRRLAAGRGDGWWARRLRAGLDRARDRRAPAALDAFRRSLDAWLPELEKRRVALAFENLPAGESVPNEAELWHLLRRYNTPWLRHWHDFGHGRIRENLGLVNDRAWVERLAEFTAGFHIHDAAYPDRDHLPPGQGDVDFAAFASFVRDPALRIFEPEPGLPAAELVAARERLEKLWSATKNG